MAPLAARPPYGPLKAGDIPATPYRGESVDLTALEAAVLAAISDQLEAEDAARLRAQVSSATVGSRENTGAGFFTDFDLQKAPELALNTDTTNCNVEAVVDALQYGMGFILFLENGYIHLLEGYAHGDESTESLDLTALKFSSVDNTRRYLS